MFASTSERTKRAHRPIRTLVGSCSAATRWSVVRRTRSNAAVSIRVATPTPASCAGLASTSRSSANDSAERRSRQSDAWAPWRSEVVASSERFAPKALDVVVDVRLHHSGTTPDVHERDLLFPEDAIHGRTSDTEHLGGLFDRDERARVPSGTVAQRHPRARDDRAIAPTRSTWVTAGAWCGCSPP